MKPNKIAEIRNILGLSQKDLADRIRVTQTAVSDWENGRRNVSKRSAASICRAFNISPEWLEEGRGPMFQDKESAPNEPTSGGPPNPFSFAKGYGLPDSVALFVEMLCQSSEEELLIWSEFLPFLFPLFESFASEGKGGAPDRFGARFRKRLETIKGRRRGEVEPSAGQMLPEVEERAPDGSDEPTGKPSANTSGRPLS